MNKLTAALMLVSTLMLGPTFFFSNQSLPFSGTMVFGKHSLFPSLPCN